MKKKIKDFGRELIDNIMDAFENPYLLWMVVAIVCSIIYFSFSKEMSEDEYTQCTQLVQEAACSDLVEVPKGYSLTRYNDEELCARKSGIFYHGAVYATKQDSEIVLERDYRQFKLVVLSLSFGFVASWFLLLFLCGIILIAKIIYDAAENIYFICYEFIVSRRERGA